MEATNIVSPDFAGQIIEQLQPILTDLALKLFAVLAGMHVLKIVMSQVFKILQGMEDQADWDRVYKSNRPYWNDKEMGKMKDEFWGKGNRTPFRTRRARKRKFFVD